MLCAMHCGTQHSEMGGWVYVMSKKDYSDWLANGGTKNEPIPMNLAEGGKKIWNLKGCGNCHGNTDTVRGPSLVDIYGKTRQLEDGTAVADTAYLRESIMTPWLRITKGYEETMPAYQGQMSEEDVLKLIEYLKTNSNMSTPGKMTPYTPTGPGGTRMDPSAGRNATNLSNDSDSAGMTQTQQGGVDQR